MRDIEAVSTRLPPEPTNRLVAGIDVAGSDDGDETVLVIRDGPTIVHMRRWTVADIRGEVALELSQFKDRLESVNVDSCSTGHYFCLHLEDLGYPVVRGNVGSAPMHDAEGPYLNRRIAFGSDSAALRWSWFLRPSVNPGFSLSCGTRIGSVN